jgi:DNA-binding transcriptional MerR regulator
VPTLTAKEAAERLGVSIRQLDRYDARQITHPVQRVPGGPRKYDADAIDRLAREGAATTA